MTHASLQKITRRQEKLTGYRRTRALSIFEPLFLLNISTKIMSFCDLTQATLMNSIGDQVNTTVKIMI